MAVSLKKLAAKIVGGIKIHQFRYFSYSFKCRENEQFPLIRIYHNASVLTIHNKEANIHYKITFQIFAGILYFRGSQNVITFDLGFC